MSSKRFEELLKKAIAGNITENEKAELLNDYIEPETPELFSYVQTACDHKYSPAYYSMGNMYLKGAGCEKSVYLAFVYWNHSVNAGGRGYTEIGDCYRLGAGGVDQDLNEALDFYRKASEHGEVRFANISPEEYIAVPEHPEDENFVEDEILDEETDEDEECFECRCCHGFFSRNEASDPETDICDECLSRGGELAHD